MKEKIERFSNGDFEYKLPFIYLSEEEISITVEAGKVYEGSFTISNSSNCLMKGYVYSSSHYMQPLSDTFHDILNTINFRFDATTINTETQVFGEFNIVSDCKEIVLPFTVTIEAPYFMTSLGKIKDLFQFANLARMDWSEAKRIFKSEDFVRVFLTNEDRFQIIYHNLIKSISTSQALEEFLIAIRKKSAIRLDIDKTSVEYEVTNENIIDKLILTKNHWGYAEIRVSSDSPFIVLDQKFLWADRFIGNTHQIAYTIDPGYLGNGNNYGHIIIKSAYQTIIVEILCKYKKDEGKSNKNHLVKYIDFELTEAYMSFRLNQIDLVAYADKTEEIIKRLPGPEVSYVRDLLRTHLAVISGKKLLAQELLTDFEKDETILRKKSALEYSAYLYLKALYYKEEITIKNTADTIRRLYVSGHRDWRLLWFLLYTDTIYEKNNDIKLLDIKEQFDRGCRSPILYYEAVCIYNEEPYLLRELSDFEIQCLNFGIKHGILLKEAAKQYTYQTTKLKGYHPVVFKGLVQIYEEYKYVETLSAICCMLIKGMKKSEKYFEWFRLAVEAQLRITELYEYYMYSINQDMQDKILQPVLLYFIYNSSLNDNRKAFLYASIIKNKDKNEPIYRSYYKKMEVFTFKMLEGHYINQDLALLYQEFLNKQGVGAEELKHLPYVLYQNEFICSNPNITNVIVIHKELGVEENTPLTDGRAQINIYTSNPEVFLVDSFGNRYVETVEYSVKPYFISNDLESRCMEHSDHPMLLLHLFDHYQNYRILNEASVELRKKVLTIGGLSREYIAYCQQSLIDYYYDNYKDELLELYLEEVNLSDIKQRERTKYIEYTLIRGFYKKALMALESYGFEGLSVTRLLKLCSGWIKTYGSDKEQTYLLNLCFYVFSHGKYDEAVLNYLIKFYKGPTRRMYNLWQAAKGFELESHILEERLLTQMLFTESYIENSFQVFSSYYKEVSNHLLIRAYLSYYAYRYLLHDQVIDQELFKVMKRELFYEENDVCMLAWLKNNTSNTSMSENEMIFTEFNIQRFVRKGIILPFFLEYRKELTLPDQILDKLYISYHADPKNQVFIHYRLAQSQEYVTQRLPNTFMGIHTKEFILFYHEELQYYITEEMQEESNITESLNVHYECDTPQDDDSNYNLINLMLISKEMQDDFTLLGMMEDYARKEYMIQQCFKQIE